MRLLFVALAVVVTTCPALATVEQCAADLTALLNHTTTAMKVLNTWGHPPAGLPYDLFWLGDFDGCQAMAPLHYCLVSINVQPSDVSLSATIQYGTCVPASCTDETLPGALNSVETIVLAAIEKATGKKIKPIDLSRDRVSCAYAKPLTSGAIATIALCSFLGFFVVVATLRDVFASAARKWKALGQQSKLGGAINGDTDDDDPLIGSGTTSLQLQRDTYRVEEPLVLRMLSAFSVARNLPKLLSTATVPESIDCLNGVRVLSMMWVVLCHTYFWMLQSGMGNPLLGLKWIQRMNFQIIVNGFFSVDSFFYLSGFLVGYGIIRALQRGRFPVSLFYLHRYLRLTPIYAFVILLYYHLGPYWGNGPMWATGYESKPARCGSDWWTNMLYINNFYPVRKGLDECMGWSWYLAIDMQLFLVTPLLVIPLYRYGRKGLAWFTFVLVACLAATFAISMHYKLRANLLAGLFNTDMPRPGSGDYSSLVYEKPYTRAAPYLVGILTAVFVTRERDRKANGTWRRMALWQVLGIHALMLALMFVLQFGLQGEMNDGGLQTKWSQVADALYITFARMGWGVGLGWLTYASDNGYTGVVGRFLSASAFKPLGRLTYTAYLIHPVILDSYYGSRKSMEVVTDLTQIVNFFGLISIVYMAAFLLTLCVEFPIGQLEKLLFDRRKK